MFKKGDTVKVIDPSIKEQLSKPFYTVSEYIYDYCKLTEIDYEYVRLLEDKKQQLWSCQHFTKIETVGQQIKEELERLKKLSSEIKKKQDEIRNLCKHEETVVKKEFTDGGYDYVAKTEYKHICVFCGKITEIETVQHVGWYS